MTDDWTERVCTDQSFIWWSKPSHEGPPFDSMVVFIKLKLKIMPYAINIWWFTSWTGIFFVGARSWTHVVMISTIGLNRQAMLQISIWNCIGVYVSNNLNRSYHKRGKKMELYRKIKRERNLIQNGQSSIKLKRALACGAHQNWCKSSPSQLVLTPNSHSSRNYLLLVWISKKLRNFEAPKSRITMI